MWGWGGQETPEAQPAVDTSQPDAVVDLNDQLQHQQQLITQLKEMVRNNEQTLQVKEKELEENASKLSKIKLQHKAKVSQLNNQLQEAQKRLTSTGSSVPPGGAPTKDEEDDASSEGSHASHTTEHSSRGRLLLLKKKLEESRSAFEKRESEVQKQNQEIEEVVGNLRKQLHERDETITKLQTPAVAQSTDVTSSSDQDQNSVDAHQMYAQIVYKDTKIQELNNRIMELEAKVIDLQDHVRDKDEVIQSRNKAIQLMAEDLSRKGKATVDQLDDTKDEMRQMQQTFVTMESCWKEERERLVGELETSKEKYIIEAAEKENRICDLKETMAKFEAARFDMSARNAALQEKVVVLQETLEKVRDSRQSAGDGEKLLKEVKELRSHLEEKEHHIRELQSALDDKPSGSKSAVKLKAQYVSRIKALEKQLSEAKSSSKSTDVHQLQQQIAELEDEKGNLQLKLVDFDDLKAAEVKHLEVINELKIQLNQQSDDLTNHVRMVSLLQQEKMDFAESLKKARQEMSSIAEQQSDMSDAKVALEMKVVELEEFKDGLEVRNKDLLQEIQNLKENLENERRPVMAIEDEKDALQIKLNEFTDILHDKDSRITQLEEELSSANNENVGLQDKVHQMENELSSAKEQIDSKEEVFSQVSEKQKKVQDLLSVFCEDHGILEPTVDHMTTKWDDLLSEKQHLQEEVTQFCERRSVHTLEELDIVWDTLKQNEAALQEEVAKCKSELSSVYEQLDQLQKFCEELKLDSKAEKESLNVSIKELTQANEILNCAAADQNNQLSNTIKELQEAIAAAGVLEGQVSELKSQLEASNGEHRHLSSLLQERHEQLEQFNAIVTTKDKDMDNLKNVLVQNETQLEAVTAELHIKSEATIKLQSNIGELEEKLQSHVNHNDKIHQQMETANQSFVEQLADMEQEVTRLQNIVDEKETIVRTLQEERDRLSKTTEGLAQELSMHKEEIHILRLQKDADISHLQQQNQDIQELKRTAHEKELQWQADSNDKSQAIENLTLSLKKSEQTCGDVAKKLNESAVEINSMQQLLEKKNKDLGDLQDEVLELKSRLQEVKESLSSKEQLHAKLEEDLCEQIRNGEAAEKTIEQFKEKNLLDAQMIDELSEAKHQLEINVEANSHVFANLEKNAEELKASSHFLKEQLDMKGKDSEEQVVSLQREHQRLENVIQQKSTELEQSHSELQELNCLVIQLKEENKVQAKAEKTLQASFDDKVVENQQFSKKVEDLNRQLSESTYRADQLQEENYAHAKAEKILQTSVQDKTAEHQQLGNRIEDLNRQLSESTYRADHLQLVNSEVESTARQLESEKQLLEQKAVELQEVIAHFKHEKNVTDEKLTQSMNTLGSSNTELKKELDEYKDKCHRLQEELDVVTQQFSASIMKSSETDAALSSIQLEVASANETMSLQLSELQEYAKRLTEAEKRSSELEEDLKKSVNQVSSFTERLQAAESETAKLHEDNDKLEHLYHCTLEELDNEKTSSALIRDELSEIGEIKRCLDVKVEEAACATSQLSARLHESTELNTQLQSHLSSVQAELEDLKQSSSQQANELKSRLQDVEERYTYLVESETEDKKEVSEKLKQLHDEKHELLGKVTIFQKTIEELEFAHNALQAENEKWQHAVSRASEQNDKLTAYTQQLEADLQSIQEAWEKTNQENIQVQEELVANKNSLVSEIEQSQLLRNQLVSLQEEQKAVCNETSQKLKRNAEELEMLKKDNEVKRTAIVSLLSDTDVHTGNITLLQDSCRAYQKSADKLEKDVVLLRKEVQSKQQEIDQLTEQAQTLNQMVGALEEQVAVKQSELETNVQFIEDLQRAVACKDSVIEGLQKESSVQTNLLTQYKAEIAGKQAEISQLENDIQIYTQNIVRMQTRLNNFMESEGNKEEDRQKLIDQLNQLENSLSRERTDRHKLEMRLADLAQVKENVEDISTQMLEQTKTLAKVQSEKESLQQLVVEMQQQMDTFYAENVTEKESLVQDIEQMKLYIVEQNKLVDVTQNEKRSLEEHVRKLGTDLNITNYEDLEELLQSVKERFTSLEDEIPVYKARSVEAYELLRDIVILTLGEDATEITTDAAKQAWIDKNAQIETLCAAVEEKDITATQLQQEIVMLQHEKQNLIEANKQFTECRASSAAVSKMGPADETDLDFVTSCLEGSVTLQEPVSIVDSSSYQESNIASPVLEQENARLKDEVSALKVQLSQLIDNQEERISRSAFSWGVGVEQDQTVRGQTAPKSVQPTSSHNHEQQLQEIMELVESEDNRPVSFQSVRKALQAQKVKLEVLTCTVLESEMRISQLQDDVNVLQEENQRLKHVASISQNQTASLSAPTPRINESAVDECLQGLQGDWETGDDYQLVGVEVEGGSIRRDSATSKSQVDTLAQENFTLKEEIQILKSRLSEMINHTEVNVEKHVAMLGTTEVQFSEGQETSPSNVHTQDFAVRDVLKIIFTKVPEHVTLEQVKSVLKEKDASLLEMNVKIENLQVAIQNLEEEKKALLHQHPEELVHSKSSLLMDDSITATLEMIESSAGIKSSSNSSGSGLNIPKEECKMFNETSDGKLIRENLSLQDEISVLKTKLSEMVELNEVTVAKQGDVLGNVSQKNEILPLTDSKSILQLIFDTEVVNSNPDDIRRALQQKNDRLDELTAMLLEAEVSISNLQLEMEDLKMESTKLQNENCTHKVIQPTSKVTNEEGLKAFEEAWTDVKFKNTIANETIFVGSKADECIVGDFSCNKEEFETLLKENHNLQTQVNDLQQRLCLIVEKTETAKAQRASLLGSVECDEMSNASLTAEPTLSSVDSDVLSISPTKENLSTLDTSADSRFVELMDEIERLKELNDVLGAKCREAQENEAPSSKTENQLALLSAELKTALQEKDGCQWAIDELKAENDELVARIQESSNEIKRLQQMLTDERSQWEIERLQLHKNASLAQPTPVTEHRVMNEKLQTTGNSDSEALNTNYTKATEELAVLKVKNGKMLAKLKQFKDKNDKLQKELDAATAPKTESPSVLDELRATVDVLSREKSEIQLQLTATCDENSSLKTELNFFKHQSLSVESSIKSTQRLQHELNAIQNENSELKHRMEELSDTNHILTLENEKLKRVAADANERSEALLSDNNTFQMLVEKSKTSKTKLDAELKNQVTLLFHANEENKKLHKSIDSLESMVTSFKDLDAKYRELEQDWHTTKTALLETEKSVDEARHKVQQLHRENETLRKDKVELELKFNSELSDQERMNTYTKEIQQLTKKFHNAQQENEKLLCESKTMHEQISAYREEIEDLHTNAASLEQQLESYKEQIEVAKKAPTPVTIIDESRQFAPIKTESPFSNPSYLHEELEHLGRDRAKLQDSVSSLTASVQEMKAELELNISEKNSLLYKLEGWRDQSEKLNAENEELRKRHQRLQDISEQLETEKQSLMQQLHQMKGELEQAQWLCQRQNEEVATLKAVTEKQDYDLKNLSQQNESLLVSVQQLTTEKQSLEAATSSLQQDVTRLKSSNDSLTQQSDNWRKHLNSISSNLTLPDTTAPSESRAKTVEPPLAHLQAELHQSMQSLHRRNQRCEELSEELASLLEERDDLQFRLSSVVRDQHHKDTQIQQLQRRLEDQEELAHSVAAQAVSYHSSLEKVELGLELDEQQPLMLPATSYTLTRTMASTSWRIRSWMQGRKNYLHRAWNSRSSLKLLYYMYILCLHILILFCAFER